MKVIRELAEIYPQLYLDPDRYGIDAYKSVVLRGDRPESEDLSHFVMDPSDRMETIETPAGMAQVITLYNRADFELFNRCMMAAKNGPEDQIPANMGAATIITFNWPRINAHKENFFREQHEAGVLMPDWPSEFRNFRKVKENYMDMIIVLSRGPYSSVSAEEAAAVLNSHFDEETWLDISDSIRKYHELTHFVCRKLYPDKIDAVKDELTADAAGIYAAFGRYERRLEELFLGIKDGSYTGGRIENYIDDDSDIEALTKKIGEVLDLFEEAAEHGSYGDVFSFMFELEKICLSIA